MKKVLGVLMAVMAISLMAFQTIASAMEPKVIAASFHSDSCGSCKILKPAFEEAKAKFEGDENVKFIKFDKTNEETSAAAHDLAEDMGLGGILHANEKTGFVILIDVATNEVVGKLTKDMTSDQMAGLIALAASGQKLPPELLEAMQATGNEMKGSGDHDMMEHDKGSMKGSN